MSTLETYFEKKARKERQDELKAIKLTKEILQLSFDLHQVLPYPVNTSLRGHVNWVEVEIVDDKREVLWSADAVFIKGVCLNLKLLTRLRDILKTAVNTRSLPEEL